MTNIAMLSDSSNGDNLYGLPIFWAIAQDLSQLGSDP
jgi:hypothetical protein